VGEGGHIEGKGGNEVVASNSIRVARGLPRGISAKRRTAYRVCRTHKKRSVTLASTYAVLVERDCQSAQL
jgi:hypothetical protein